MAHMVATLDVLRLTLIHIIILRIPMMRTRMQISNYGIGSSDYYYLYGPLDDPSYNGTTTEAQSYGETQGNTAIANFVDFYDQSSALGPTTPVIWVDLENYSGDGWSSTASLNRAVYNGFHDATSEVQTTIKGEPIDIWAGVYTNAGWWNANMTGTLSGAFEWTSEVSVSSPSSSDCASGWSSPDDNSATFYAGYTTSSLCAAMWQWVSGSADYDQIDGPNVENGLTGNCN